MAEDAAFKPTNVKDVPAQAFIEAYAAHLKSNDKVSGLCGGCSERCGRSARLGLRGRYCLCTCVPLGARSSTCPPGWTLSRRPSTRSWRPTTRTGTSCVRVRLP